MKDIWASIHLFCELLCSLIFLKTTGWKQWDRILVSLWKVGWREAMAGFGEAELGTPSIQEFSRYQASAWSPVLLQTDFFQAAGHVAMGSHRSPSW